MATARELYESAFRMFIILGDIENIKKVLAKYPDLDLQHKYRNENTALELANEEEEKNRKLLNQQIINRDDKNHLNVQQKSFKNSQQITQFLTSQQGLRKRSFSSAAINENIPKLKKLNTVTRPIAPRTVIPKVDYEFLEAALRAYAKLGRMNEVAELLKEYPRLNLDAKDKDGNTALMLCAKPSNHRDQEANCAAVARILIENGANPGISNILDSNKTVSDYAIDKDVLNVIKSTSITKVRITRQQVVAKTSSNVMNTEEVPPPSQVKPVLVAENNSNIVNKTEKSDVVKELAPEILAANMSTVGTILTKESITKFAISFKDYIVKHVDTMKEQSKTKEEILSYINAEIERTKGAFEGVNIKGAELEEAINIIKKDQAIKEYFAVDVPSQTVTSAEAKVETRPTIDTEVAKFPQAYQEKMKRLFTEKPDSRKDAGKYVKMFKMLPEGAVYQKILQDHAVDLTKSAPVVAAVEVKIGPQLTKDQQDIIDRFKGTEDAQELITQLFQSGHKIEQIEKYTKMLKMLPVGAVKQKMMVDGIELKASSELKKEAALLLDETDYTKPVKELAEKMQQINSEDIIKNNYIIGAINAGNHELAAQLMNKVANAPENNNFTKEKKKEILTNAAIAFLQRTEEITKIQDIINQTKEKIRTSEAEYKRIEALPINSPELKDTLLKEQLRPQTISIPEWERGKADRDKVRHLTAIEALMNKKYSNRKTDTEALEKLLAEQKESLETKLRAIANTIKIAVEKGRVDRNDQAIQNAINSHPGKMQINKMSPQATQVKTVQDTVITLVESSMIDKPPALNETISNLISVYQKEALALDTKRNEVQMEKKNIAYKEVTDAILANLIDQTIKLRKLQEVCKGHGYICPDLEKYISESLEHHITKTLNYKDDPAVKQNTMIVMKKFHKTFTEDSKHEEAVKAVTITQTSKEDAEKEMRVVLEQLGIKPEKVNVITIEEHPQERIKAGSGRLASSLVSSAKTISNPVIIASKKDSEKMIRSK